MSGQKAVREVLRREVETGQLSHAYLFCGTRGTGKTTAAKILAKAVNCRSPRNGNPCNECDLCRGIDEGSILDVLEIDAASNNGVDNVREIREEVQYTPAVARYRVYIIDEVHMLSPGAFNALLKTLEEPPEHVIFILATTERHKIPATILSRCQCFEFVRIPAGEIVARLQQVARAEGFELEERAAELIARLSDGALRNALSLLEQCAALGNPVTQGMVMEIAGLSGREHLFEVSAAVAAKDGAQVLRAARELAASSQDLAQVTVELLTHFRDLLLCKTLPSPESMLDAPPDEHALLHARAQDMTAGDILSAIGALQQALDAMMRSTHRQVLLELALLGLTTPALDTTPAGLLARLERLERKMEQAPPPAPPAARAQAPVSPAAQPQQPVPQPPQQEEDAPPWEVSPQEAGRTPAPAQGAPERVPPAEQPSAKGRQPAQGAPAFWGDLLAQVEPSVAGFLSSAGAVMQGDVLVLTPGSKFAARMLQKESVRAEIAQKLSRVAGRPCSVAVGESPGAQAPQENPLFEQLATKIEALQQEEK